MDMAPFRGNDIVLAIYLTASSVLGDKEYYILYIYVLLQYNFMCLCWLLVYISSALQLLTRSAYIPRAFRLLQPGPKPVNGS